MTTWVLLRGLAREAGHWGTLPSAWRLRLPPGDALVAIDLPGNGARWREAAPVTVAGMAQAARAELARGPHGPPYVLVALSLGAMVALHWAATCPGELRGCVLVNTSLRGLSPLWQRLRPRSWASLLGLLAPGRSVLGRERAVLALTSNRPVAERTALAWAGLARERPVTRANVLRQLLAAARFRAPLLAQEVPLLLLASQRDRLVSVRCSRAAARAWGAPLREHPWAGHDLALDDPRWLVDQVMDWQAGGAFGASGLAGFS